MEHEALPLLSLEALDFLRVFSRAERAGDERLRLAAREHGGAVRPRQDAGFGPDRPDLVELAAVEAQAALEHFVAQHLFLEILEDLLRFDLALHFAFGQRRDEILEQLVDAIVVLELAADAHRLGERHEHFLLHLAIEVVPDLLLLDLKLLLAGFAREIVDRGDDLFDRRVRRLERPDHLVLAHFLCARFDHHDAVLAARDDEVQHAPLALFERRVDEELAVDHADAHAGDRLLERDVRQRERRRGAGNCEHVGVVLLIGREHEGDDLRLEAPPRGEERPDRPIDDAARQHFLLGGLAFTLEEAAGDSA